MAKYIVKQGDCISSIAYEHGFFGETVWNHSQNSPLKNKRKDPNVLYPSDEVFIPDTEQKQESRDCEQEHQFQLKSVPAKLKVKLLLNGKPRANEEFKLYVDDLLIKEGKTKTNGLIENPIPPNAESGKIVLKDQNENEETYYFSLGTLDPVDTTTGWKARLKNLGYYLGEINESINDEAKDAIKAFQKKNNLTASGLADDNTLNLLKKQYEG